MMSTLMMVALLGASAATELETEVCPVVYQDLRKTNSAAKDMDDCSRKSGFSFSDLRALDAVTLESMCPEQSCQKTFQRLLALGLPRNCIYRGIAGDVDWYRDIVAPWKTCDARSAAPMPSSPASSAPTLSASPTSAPSPQPVDDSAPSEAPRTSRSPAPLRTPPTATHADAPVSETTGRPTPAPRTRTRTPRTPTPQEPVEEDSVDDPGPLSSAPGTSPGRPKTSSRRPSASLAPVPEGSHEDEPFTIMDEAVASQPSPAGDSKKRYTPAPTIVLKYDNSSDATVITVAVGVCAGVLFIAALVGLTIRRRQRLAEGPATDTLREPILPSTIPQSSPTMLLLNCMLSSFYVPGTELEDVKVLGTGSHTAVFLVRHRQGRLLTSKRLLSSQFSSHRLDDFVKEIRLAASLQHQAIIEFVGASWTSITDLQALFEFVPNGDLRSYLDASTSRVWTREKIQLALDVAEALAYAHAHMPPVLHQSLQARKVLLTADYRAKVSDFGVSHIMTTDNVAVNGASSCVQWLAPELLTASTKASFTNACDVYAFGALLSEMDTHRVPFSDVRRSDGGPLKDTALQHLIARGQLQPALSASCPPCVAELARRCLCFEPHKRPTAAEASSVLRRLLSIRGVEELQEKEI
ncbi:hypothetical protein PINS_up007761 [Pythium insidiosum]|nr:hypothetical protein PINS_up007761 [Pythium insidiosum]